MHGRDPMAMDVSQAFSRATYVPVKVLQDMQIHHFEGQMQIVLVDLVVNTKKSAIGIVDVILCLIMVSPYVRIVMVAGIVQAQYLYKNSVM